MLSEDYQMTLEYKDESQLNFMRAIGLVGWGAALLNKRRIVQVAISYTDVAKLDAQFLENRTRYNDNLFSGDDNFFFFSLLL